MKLPLRFFILLCCFLCSMYLKAQHPVYYQLTEKDGLPDIEFYKILEDKNGFIWLAANKGLFRYDGKEFLNYSHPEKRGLSVFNLQLDERGRIWCNNISGQYFYIENDKLELFADIEEEANGQEGQGRRRGQGGPGRRRGRSEQEEARGRRARRQEASG